MADRTSSPLVSVILPVYNGEQYVREALGSLLNQTLRDFEIILVNDGSSDNTAAVLESFTDPRLKVRHQENKGLTASLNRGISLCTGKFIARMDVDDLNHPQRLERQVEYLKTHPRIGICGTWIKHFGNGREHVVTYPTDSASIKSVLLFHSPIAHPSIMARRDILLKNRYEEGYPCAEDYELWVRCARHTEFANIPEVLYFYRIHADQETQKHLDAKSSSTGRIRAAQIKELGISPAEEELALHASISGFSYTPSWQFIEKTDAWFNKLCRANSQARVYPDQAFRQLLADRWFDICYNAKDLGFRVFIRYMSSPLHRHSSLTASAKLKFGIKSMIKR